MILRKKLDIAKNGGARGRSRFPKKLRKNFSDKGQRCVSVRFLLFYAVGEGLGPPALQTNGTNKLSAAHRILCLFVGGDVLDAP